MQLLICCRTCKVDYGEFVTLDSEIRPTEPLVDLLTECTNLKVSIGDKLPQMLCEVCVQDLKRLKEFVCKARDADNYWKEQLDKQNKFRDILSEENHETSLNSFKENCNKSNESRKNKENGVEFHPMTKICKVEIIDNVEEYLSDDDEECKSDNTTKTQHSLSDAENEKNRNEVTEEYVEIARLKSTPPQLHVRKIKRNKELSKKSVDNCTTPPKEKPLKPKNFKCPTCGKCFATTQKLKQHDLVHTKARDYECPICGKRFATVYRKRDHIKIHTKERNFDCSLCDRKFTTRAYLKMHQQSHASEREFVCKLCNKKFRHRSAHKIHMNRHEGKTFDCDICQRKFNRKSQVTIHKRLHTGERPYKCTQCDSAYLQKSHLNRHIGVHMGVRFKCTDCDKEYTKKSSLTKHIKKEHPT